MLKHSEAGLGEAANVHADFIKALKDSDRQVLRVKTLIKVYQFLAKIGTESTFADEVRKMYPLATYFK